MEMEGGIAMTLLGPRAQGLVAFALLGAFAAAPALAQPAAIDDTVAAGIREHIDEADDAVDDLLQWRHVLSDVSARSYGAPRPTAPASTLISVERSEVERVNQLVAAALMMLPAAAPADRRPRGDVRAHLVKAQEIARELLPPPATGAAAVGTTGTDGATVTIDRTALLRLEIELDAAERVAPRRLTPPATGR
jgi:hypothetical protein